MIENAESKNKQSSDDGSERWAIAQIQSTLGASVIVSWEIHA